MADKQEFSMAGDGWLALAGTALGAVIGPATMYFIKRWNRPILTATVEPKQGSLVDTPAWELAENSPADPTKPNSPTGKMKFARLKVRNAGRRDPAIKCRGTLIKIEKLDGGVWKELDYYEAGQLIWANVGVERELPKDVPVYLDLCKVDCKAGWMRLCVQPELLMYQDVINADGSYLFHILLTAENADHIRKVARINWNKSTMTLEIEIVK